MHAARPDHSRHCGESQQRAAYTSTSLLLFVVFFLFVCAQFGSIESCTGFAGFYLSRAFALSLLAITDVRSWDMSLTLAQNLKLGSNHVQHPCLGRALGPFFVSETRGCFEKGTGGFMD